LYAYDSGCTPEDPAVVDPEGNADGEASATGPVPGKGGIGLPSVVVFGSGTLI
jgi:hypothetical protein